MYKTSIVSHDNAKLLTFGLEIAASDDLTREHKDISVLLWLTEAEWRIYALVNYPSLVQIMACRLVGAKPLSEPMLEYY